jgi:hypothetical protein
MLEQVKESNPDRPLLLMLSGHGACIGDEAVLYPSTHNGQTSHRRRCGGRPFRKSSIRLLTRGPHLWPSYSIAPGQSVGASCNPLIKLSTLNSAVLFASTPGTAAQVDMAAGLGVLSKQWHQSLDAEPGSTDFLNVAARTISERRPDEYRQTFWLFSSLLQPIPIPAKGGQSSSSTR